MELIVIVEPMVVVPTYIFAHLYAADPILYVVVVAGNKSPVMVVVAAARVPPKIALPEP